MSTFIALLRGINVSGQKIIKMTDLKAMFESVGCTEVQTYIQSGNVVFDHPDSDAGELRRKIEAHIQAQTGDAVPTLLRTHAELAVIVAANPYDESLADFGKRMYVCFFDNPPSEAAIASILPFTHADEQLEVRGREAFVYYSEGLGKAKLSHALIERRLGMTTMRNWNTVNKLLEMSRPHG